MFTILNDEVRNLLKEVTPWIVGVKNTKDKLEPIFKDDTPEAIKLKHSEIIKLCES